MAFRILQACKVLISPNFSTRLLTPESTKILQLNSTAVGSTPLVNIVRNGTFFNRYTAEHLWHGATAVSNAGRKRGRTKSRRMIKNLNKGQIIGVGKVNMLWPGLNSPVLRGKEFVKQQQLPEDPEREKNLFKIRDSVVKRRRAKIHPLERGWSGGKPGGRAIGPPDPVGDETFEGFDSRILEYKMVCTMTGVMGRKRRISTLVITGNKNGLAGFALGKTPEGRSALRMAKNRAATKLMYIPRHEERTVYHDFFCQFGETKIFVSKKPQGYGLVCQRAIKSCCEVIGIKDLYAKIEGSTNVQKVVKAFFIGLLQQKTYEQLAEEKKLHVVEFRPEAGNFPNVLASPAEVRKQEEVPFDEVRDFTQYVMGGKVKLLKKKPRPFYETLPSWQKRLRKVAYLRNKDDVSVQLRAEYGDLHSFYTKQYPEAQNVDGDLRKPRKEEPED